MPNPPGVLRGASGAIWTSTPLSTCEEPYEHVRPHIYGRRPRPGKGTDRTDAPGAVHERPVGQRVPARPPGRLRPARPGRRELDLPHRHPDRRLEAEPGDGRPVPGHVRRPG